jgi:AhpD family alkylhydroperoxidase
MLKKGRQNRENVIMKKQLELYDEIARGRAMLHQGLPGVGAACDTLRDEVYKDRALDTKIKRLIALGIALRAGCTGCIIGQTKLAVEAGATKAEILEAISVAISMGGTPARAWAWRAVKTLEELGKW